MKKEEIEFQISETKRQRVQFWELMSDEDKRIDDERLLDLERQLKEAQMYEIKEENGMWYVTVATGPNGASSGMAYEKLPGETIEDVKNRLPRIIDEYQNAGK